ncbi:hypothetical protein BO71DRAFT_349162 [Aspergillus ellipticus CBS 707.79]|uniref:FRG1-like family protein n=1 Tax=Aspergillus ellipticus CBS 707.79 TaxID=1448320 RepID=A0A319DFW2_9EURO|nr:hypothetical protein BO71DRAFT_349162 [Aspergillus ellipticus CBS 707.79]
MVKPLSFKGDKPKKRKHDSSSTSDPSRKKPSTTTPSSTAAAPPTDPDADAHALEASAEDQSWVTADTPSDLAGPIMFVLPTATATASEPEDSAGAGPPTCLATDAHGTVFASVVENLIEGDPATAEPHDVRQVWVATKVAGVEGWSFRGSNGKYLSSDKHGILSATASAISRHEVFGIREAESGGGGLFTVVTGTGTPPGSGEEDKDKKEKKEAETYLSVKEVLSKTTASGTKIEVRGDVTGLSSGTNIRIRMQARFKPRIKASKEIRAREKIGRKELEGIVGRRLDEEEVRRLRKARKEGDFHEVVLDVKVRGKHDKFA